MLLRVVLVSVVASLGFDLPEAQRFEDWARSGRAWCCSTLEAWVPRDIAAPTGTESLDDLIAEALADGPAAPAADDAFATVVDDLAATFADDARLARTAGPVLVYEAADDDHDLALALNRANEGAPTRPEPTALARAEEPSPEPAANEPAAEPEPDPDRNERLADAVRLTRSALGAWASLLRQPPALIHASR